MLEIKKKITLIALYGQSGPDEQSNIVMALLKADINTFENQLELHPIVMIEDFNVADYLHDTTSLTLKSRTIDSLEQIYMTWLPRQEIMNTHSTQEVKEPNVIAELIKC